METGHVTASICFLIIAAGMYSAMLGMSGISNELERWVTQAHFGQWSLLLVYLLILLVLGTLLDSISIMLITVPIFLPLFAPFGLNLVWLGVLTVIVVEIGLLTPPLGISVYVVKNTLNEDDISLADIFAGAAPFALIMLAVAALVVAVPAITTVF